MKLAASAAGFLLLLGCSAYAATAVIVQDPTNVNRNLGINSDGSANITCVSGCSGGGGGGAVTIADGADVVEGAAAAAAACPSGSAKSVAGCLAQIHADATSPIPAGSALIGKVNVETNVGTLPLIQATASAPISFTAAGGPTQIIAASGSTKVYVTHIHYVLSGAGTFALITGTGTNCGTGTTYLEGASGHPLSYAANGGISAGSGLGPIYVTGAGGEICAITTGAVDISGTISYAQF